jgi:ribosomal subunit interface protein
MADVDIVVRGRHIELSDRFREHVAGKLAKVERYDGKCHRIDVEVSGESNPRLADQAVRIELTCHGKGPVIRAEASADEKYAALDLAVTKLEEQLRRAADRRSDHQRAKGRAVTARASSSLSPVAAVTTLEPSAVVADQADAETEAEGPMVVREKTHRARPMTLDQALYEMELVGHDFYLFLDEPSGTPSVVYRRKGYDYGVLHLEAEPD